MIYYIYQIWKIKEYKLQLETRAGMKYTYRIRTDERVDEDGNSIVVYGIEAAEGSSVLPAHSVPDLFTERADAEKLVRLCNRLELDPVHLLSVCEDALV